LPSTSTKPLWAPLLVPFLQAPTHCAPPDPAPSQPAPSTSSLHGSCWLKWCQGFLGDTRSSSSRSLPPSPAWLQLDPGSRCLL
jgi:hypothetical protein